MRGIPSLITDIRKKVFTEVARMAYNGDDYTKAEDLPYIIVPGDQPLHRESVFLERAIAGERVRLAMGLSVRSVQTRSLLTEGMDHAAIAQQYYEPPLINIIPYACHACPTNQYKVTENCQNCLAASCQQVCPRDAISFVNGKSFIDSSKCIKCGKCAQACSYNAIIHLERPCQALTRTARPSSTRTSASPAVSAWCPAPSAPLWTRARSIRWSAPSWRATRSMPLPLPPLPASSARM